MSRVRLTLIALGMAFALPALTGAKDTPDLTTMKDSACSAKPPVDHQDAHWRWRLRAYQHLDCLTAIVDRALETTSDDATRSADRIEISREDLEQIRALAWWARDAAARIGQ